MTVLVPELFTGASAELVSPRRYKSFFFILLLLGLLYPLFAFWRTDIYHPDAGDKIRERSDMDSFFIRHFIWVLVLLFLITAGASILFEYLAYRQMESIKREMIGVTELKVRQLDEWRLQHVNFALLADTVPFEQTRERAVQGNKNRTQLSESRIAKRMPAVQDKSVKRKGRFNGVDLKFLDSHGVVSVQSSDEVDDEALPQNFIRQVLHDKTISIGPMAPIREQNGREYTGFCMAVPIMSAQEPDRVKSILIYHVDPSRFLHPHLASFLTDKPGGQAVLLQKEPAGLRILGNQFDKTVLLNGANGNITGAQLMKEMHGGRTGFIKGMDVRGEPIVAYVARVADSGWMLAGQVDQEAIVGKIRKLAWTVLFLTVLFISLAVFLIFLWFRQRHLRYEAEHLKLALQQQALIQHYDFLSKYANDIILLMDEAGNIIEVNDRAETAYGYARLDLLGKNIRYLLASSKLADFEIRWNQLKREQSLIFETVNVHHDGSDFPVEISARMIKTEDTWFVQCIIRDITEKKRSEELIWQQANFDPITGLANRRMFMETLHHEIRKAARARLPLALMFLDLDKFKDVNDTLGHAIGDLLLQRVAERLKRCVRETDSIARLGGDEFTVILSGLVSFSSVNRVAKNILAEIAEPFILEGNKVHISSSIGITFFPEDAEDVETLLKNADQAMYAAKNEGGDCYHYFTPSMQEAVQTRIHLINDLRDALDKKQFEVVYQPILNLASSTIDHAEALIRWHHPVRGVISPAEFIPLAEETGMIQELSDWVFLEAARQVKKWRALIPEFKLGINVSPVQFKNGGIDIHAWFDHLNDLKLSPNAIIIEITEGLLLDVNDSITRQLLEFRDAGIAVALDDFGTGYSSLSYLTRLDIDYIKIAQTFMHNIAHSKDDKTLCEAITVMTHKLGMKVIAEGVEYQDQLDILVSMGCDFAQGFWVSQTLSADDCEKLIRSFHGLSNGDSQASP